ncbi:hypothetical protein GLYMA_20G053450v4 [Glycine max]|nr:hypothetical protein GLYMA_20G053450v4 [Glycine max]KAH1034654.1 hypothetical protein GYH30_054878 [Glycine max]
MVFRGVGHNCLRSFVLLLSFPFFMARHKHRFGDYRKIAGTFGRGGFDVAWTFFGGGCGRPFLHLAIECPMFWQK